MCSHFWIASLELQSDPAFVTPVLQEMGTWLPASSHPILHLELPKNWISDIALHPIFSISLESILDGLLHNLRLQEEKNHYGIQAYHSAFYW
jgi:hypothetical protein